MSKMSEMDLTIKSLREAAAAITDAADFLTKAFSGTDEQQSIETAAEQPEPAKEPENVNFLEKVP